MVDADGPVGVAFAVILEMMSWSNCVSAFALDAVGGSWFAGWFGRVHCVVPDCV